MTITEFKQSLEDAGFTSGQASALSEGVKQLMCNNTKPLQYQKERPASDVDCGYIRSCIFRDYALLSVLVLLEIVLIAILIFNDMLPEPINGGSFAVFLISTMLAIPANISLLATKIKRNKKQLQ